ncbi:hypothetical protein N7467_005866 [Penicillium canescens]|nr:hypothetical protein N7467_005866 [Penicillium canescens]
MAPRKVKTGATAGEDDVSIVHEYLRQQNRPYSAIDISANLHNKVTKTHATKILRDLHEKKQIEGRTSGKQTVYHALQDPSDTATPEAAAALSRDIANLQSQLEAFKANEKKARAALTALGAKPRVSDLRQDITRLESEQEAIQARLASRHEDDTVSISPAERAKLETEWKQWQRQVGIRRRICCELWGRCSEVLPENVTAPELWESLGLEGTLQ